MNHTADCNQNLSTTMKTIIEAGVTKSTELGNTKTFKDLLFQLFEKDELHFVGWAVLVVLVLLIVTCCIGCKGCCCRACCGARETRFSMNTCKVPGLARGGGHGQEFHGPSKEVAIVPITRCCYHPHHCTIDIERPFVCDCRRVCKTCSGYFPTSVHHSSRVDRDDISESPSPKPKPRKVKTEKGQSSDDPPKPYHRVQIDTMPDKNAFILGSSSKQARTPNAKGPAPSAPAPDVGFNYKTPPGAWSYTHSPAVLNPAQTRAMGFVDPKKVPEVQNPNEQGKPKEEEEEW